MRSDLAMRNALVSHDMIDVVIAVLDVVNA